MQEYKEKLKLEKVTSLSSQISKEWKALPEVEQNKWKREAERDKLRYNAEKSLYNGPWRVSAERPRKVRSCSCVILYYSVI
jgi:HMG (high mobility group) box